MSKKATVDKNNPFAVTLGKLMNKEGISNTKLGELLGMSRQAIQHYVDGTVRPNTDALRKIAEYFNVSADYLIGRIEDPTPKGDLAAVFFKLNISSESMNNIEDYEEMEQKILNYMLEQKYMNTLLSSLKEAIIETVMFAILSDNKLQDTGIPFEVDLYRRMKKWELNRKVADTIDEIYGGFVGDYWDVIEKPAKEKAKSLYDPNFNIPLWKKFFDKAFKEELDEEMNKILNEETDEENRG